MSFVIACILVAVEAFLLGSIPFGLIIGKVGYGSDPRDGGSGSIGATNMKRLFGWKACIGTFAGDVGKGALAVGIARIVATFVVFDAAWQFDTLLVIGIICSIFGHVFCPWLGFHGGKGVSTGLGSIFVGYPLVVLCMLASFLVVAFLSKRISAGSICAAISFPIFSYIFCGLNIPLLIVSTLVAIGVTFAHRGNIKRMINGTEPKFTFKDTASGNKEDAGSA